MRDLPANDVIEAAVAQAVAEDVGPGDVTAALIAPQTEAHADVTCKEPATVCGAAWFDAVFRLVDPRVQVAWRCADGAAVPAGTVVCSLTGPARGILTGERTALNFLQTLSGTATAAQRYAAAVEGTGAKVLDTRKTLPGLRQAQKYAVRCGGAYNHRQGLFDAFLIKENHIVAAGGIAAAVESARERSSGIMVEVEVETLEEVEQALASAADRLMLDDFTLSELRQAVAMRDARARAGRRSRKELEASGNVTIENIRQVASTGVDYVSVGSITKHVRAVDYSMRFVS